MAAPDILVRLHCEAPPKPALGSPCNGCGACCAYLPCPVSRLLLGHRRGVCPALVWHEELRHYRCGMATQPAEHLRWLPALLDKPMARLGRRWIAAGYGCDFDAEMLEESGSPAPGCTDR